MVIIMMIAAPVIVVKILAGLNPVAHTILACFGTVRAAFLTVLLAVCSLLRPVTAGVTPVL
jgi:hypothetical protein